MNKPIRNLPVDAASIRLTWQERGKKWILSVSWRDGSRWLHYWQYVDSRTAIGGDEAHMIGEAIRREIESWLF